VTSVRASRDIRGLETYRGRVIRADDWDVALVSRTDHVALVGVSANAARILPESVRTAASVKVFQQSAVWVLPRTELPAPAVARAAFALVPARRRRALVRRVAAHHLKRQVRDPWLRRQLTPARWARSTPLVSSDFYPALQQPNCKLITWPIASISPTGVRTSDGVEHKVDCIVLADGTR
jgi:cation diffusion facilitator CzcD-associated flavoprotein CzcO